MNAPETLREQFGTPPRMIGTEMMRLDGKGRVVVPKSFAALGNPIIIVPALEMVQPEPYWTLLLIREADWERQAKQNEGNFAWWKTYGSLSELIPLAKKTRRALIPATLRDIVGWKTGEEVVLRGMGRTVQVMAYDRWNTDFNNIIGADLNKPPMTRTTKASSFDQRRFHNHAPR